MENYPESTYIDKARFEVADCANKASLKPAYASEPTERAIKIYEDFTESAKDGRLTKEAVVTILRLKNKAAEKSFSTAEFYEKQRHYDSAIIYYKDVIDRYPESSYAEKSKTKITSLIEKNVARTRKKTAAVVKKGPAEDGAPAKKKGWLSWMSFGRKAPAGEAAEAVRLDAEAKESVALPAVRGEAGLPVPPPVEEISTEELQAAAAAPKTPVITRASGLITVNALFRRTGGWVPFRFAKKLTPPAGLSGPDSDPNYAGQEIKN